VVAGVVVLLATASGCSHDVHVDGTGATGSARTACRALVDALPERVSDQPRRTTSGSSLGAAWGDPAIVLRCGVGKPKDYDPVTGCQTADGLDWYVPEKGMNDQSVDVVMTTIGRDPRIEVSLPARYRPPVGAMVDLAAAIKAHTRQTTPCS
jgi:hypothetical protein